MKNSFSLSLIIVAAIFHSCTDYHRIRKFQRKNLISNSTESIYFNTLKKNGEWVKNKFDKLSLKDTVNLIEGISVETLSYTAQVWNKNIFDRSYYSQLEEGGGRIGEEVPYSVFEDCLRERVEKFDTAFFNSLNQNNSTFGGRFLYLTRVIKDDTEIVKIDFFVTQEGECSTIIDRSR